MVPFLPRVPLLLSFVVFSFCFIHPVVATSASMKHINDINILHRNLDQSSSKTLQKLASKNKNSIAQNPHKQNKKLDLFRKLILKNKNTISQVLVFYIVNQFLLTYVLKNNDQSVYPFLKKNNLEINDFLKTKTDFLEVSEKYFIANGLDPSYKYLPLILRLHEKDPKTQKETIELQNKKNKPLGIWQITPDFLSKISYGTGGKGKDKKEEFSDVQSTIFMAKYFKDRFEILQKNTFYVLVEFLTRKEGKNQLLDLLKEGRASTIADIEEYLDVKDRIKIREFLAVYFYDRITQNPNFDFYKDPLILDVLKKNPLF